MDPAAKQLWRGAAPVPLRPKLFAALHYLVEHSGRLITREELLRAVWSRTHVDETLLRGTMRDLRASLDAAAAYDLAKYSEAMNKDAAGYDAMYQEGNGAIRKKSKVTEQ